MKNFAILAIIWTSVVFFMVNIVFPYVEGSAITIQRITNNAPIWLAGLPAWLISGMVYTYIQEKKKKNYEKLG